jgi:CBS domain containing-hemolysin-like protein
MIALVFSFYCSIAEAVLLSLTPSYIASVEQKGKRAGRLLQHLKENIDRPLAAILSLNTIAHTLGAAGAGAQATALFGDAYLGIVSAVLTLLILVFSEIIPKTLGALHWKKLAPTVAFSINYLMIFLYPFVKLSEYITQFLSSNTKPADFSRDEFTALADVGVEEGQIEEKESTILKNLFASSLLSAKDIFTPRTVAFTLQEDMLVKDFFENHADTPFSRIPIYRENRDEITGFVLKGDLFLAQAKNQAKEKLKKFKREIKVLPEFISLSNLFEELLNHRMHIATIVNEYGGMEGIVTMEDVLESLLGLEIVDEADKAVDMQQLARIQWKKQATPNTAV